MNNTLRTGATCLLISLASPAFAASTTDLTVKGLIVPSACTPTMAANGTIDLGKIAAKDLNLTTRTYLPKPTLQMNIDCEASTLFALVSTDNRADSGSYAEYGLGLASGGQRIGGFNMSLDKNVADGAAVESIESTNNGERWSSMNPDDVWMAGSLIGFGLLTGAPAPIAAQNVTTEITLWPFISAANSLPVSEEILIDGLVTVTVNYL